MHGPFFVFTTHPGPDSSSPGPFVYFFTGLPLHRIHSYGLEGYFETQFTTLAPAPITLAHPPADAPPDWRWRVIRTIGWHEPLMNPDEAWRLAQEDGLIRRGWLPLFKLADRRAEDWPFIDACADALGTYRSKRPGELGLRDELEAALLVDDPMPLPDIADFTGLKATVVQAYACTFFDTVAHRGDEDWLVRECLLPAWRSATVVDDLSKSSQQILALRLCAATMGVHGLWTAHNAHPLGRMMFDGRFEREGLEDGSMHPGAVALTRWLDKEVLYVRGMRSWGLWGAADDQQMLRQLVRNGPAMFARWERDGIGRTRATTGALDEQDDGDGGQEGSQQAGQDRRRLDQRTPSGIPDEDTPAKSAEEMAAEEEAKDRRAAHLRRLAARDRAAAATIRALADLLPEVKPEEAEQEQEGAGNETTEAADEGRDELAEALAGALKEAETTRRSA